MKELNGKSKRDFVPEYFIWLEPDEQRRRAKELDKMTKNKDKRRK